MMPNWYISKHKEPMELMEVGGVPAIIEQKRLYIQHVYRSAAQVVARDMHAHTGIFSGKQSRW